MRNLNVLRSILVISVIICFASCARSINFNTSTLVPAAEGKIKIKQDKNKNYALKVDVKNLAEPGKLQPARSTYVVWMETEQNGVKNLGQLNSSNGVFSQALKASLETVTSFRPVSFFITAEDNGEMEYPGSQVVLRTDRYNGQ